MINVNGMFGIINDDNTVSIAWADDGCPVTRIEGGEGIWPVDSDFSAAYEHADGIIVDMDTAKSLSIELC